MPPRPLSGREKRRRMLKAERERWVRGRRGSFKRLNDVYLDGQNTGRERRIYALILTKTRGPHETVRYSTYNSHPSENWVPAPADVDEHWPKPDQWEPKNFDDKEKKNPVSSQACEDWVPSAEEMNQDEPDQWDPKAEQRLFIPRPPSWSPPPTPILN